MFEIVVAEQERNLIYCSSLFASVQRMEPEFVYMSPLHFISAIGGFLNFQLEPLIKADNGDRLFTSIIPLVIWYMNTDRTKTPWITFERNETFLRTTELLNLFLYNRKQRARK